MKNILVTGGAGFIGSHLCEALLKRKYNVICLDDLSSGRRENIEHLLKNDKFMMHDVERPCARLGAMSIDYIFHLASPASPVDYQNEPIKTLTTNSVGTYNILQLAWVNKARLVLTSTSEVYGDPLEHPQKETYWGNVNSVGPRSCYDESKRFAEALCMAYFRKQNTDIRIARIFNTFGERMRRNDGRVVSNFICQCLDKNPITIYGDGTQTRSFCYVSDMVNGLMKLMFTEGISGEVINLGNPEERTMLEIAETIKKLTGVELKTVFMPLPEDDPTRRKPDISKAKKMLNWEPVVGFENGLQKTITSFQKKDGW